ncbi:MULTISPECIES: alpha-L-rhamnosidase [Xenorhabdus]|uniref:alpha-L-rhamnosidase n=1 Tax=Xenorhabdus TaxID=626 RepID=UPI0006995591|nr:MULTISPECIES: alpha-L-rhamnosidase [Xenorhabdus]
MFSQLVFYPVDLRCEHLFLPQGLNTYQPRFTWGLAGTGRNRRQTAYRIIVGTDKKAVANGVGKLWDSGRIAATDSVLVPYAGKVLKSDQVLYWSVQVWDETGAVSKFADPAMLFTGLMDPSDWKAGWITRSFFPPDGRTPPQDTPYDNPYSALPADYHRREFVLSTPIKRATAYVTALGLYEFRINGQRVGDQVLAPGWTDFHKRIEYQSYDVTSLLCEGRNVLGAIVGEGWYCGRVALNHKRAGSHYGSRPAFLCQLHIEDKDNNVNFIVTDPQWKCANEAIIYSDLLIGEKYDARLEQQGWDCPDFDDQDWWNSQTLDVLPQPPVLNAARSCPIRKTSQFAARLLHKTKNGEFIFDIGQNIAGITRMELDAPHDAVFVLRHGEALQPDGTLYTANLRSAQATDIYISKGGQQVFEPRFTVHGYRYIALSAPENFDVAKINLTGIAVHSDLPIAGSFTSGSPMLNQLQSNIVWTQRNNFLSVPTDCPQRDERMGWLGDAQVFFNTAAYNLDTSSFFDKWLLDITDAQTNDGVFPDVAPSIVYTRFAPLPPRGAPGWGDAGVILPWRIYEQFGDVDILVRNYGGMVRWMDFIERNNPSYIRCKALFSNWGDWLCLGKTTSKPLFSTAYWAHMADIMTCTARLLNRRQDEARFTAMHREICHAFQKAFVSDDGVLESDTQTAYLMAISYTLLDEPTRVRAISHLLRTIEETGGHVQTGIHGIRLICPVLAEYGHADTAYDLLMKETFPSWGFTIRNGATTIWERWDGWTPENGFQSANMNSLNHYALGAVGEFMFSRVAGIEIVPGSAGRKLRLRPLTNRKIGFCKASYRAHVGEIVSHWRFDKDCLLWDVKIPPNCIAEAELPETQGDWKLDGNNIPEDMIRPDISGRRNRLEIGSGSYRFSLDWSQ